MTGLQLVADGKEHFRRPVMLSAGAHLALAVGILAGTLIRGVPVIWGEAGGGGAASVNLVSEASVPLPPPAVPTKNTVATENKGLNYTEPAPKPAPKTPPPPPDEKAVALPARNAKKVAPPKKVEEPPPAKREIASTGENTSDIRPTRRYKQAEEPVQNNEVPYGEGGATAGPYGSFQADGGSGGVQVTGDAGFNSRYSWYVTAIRNRISRNWLKSTVDPSIRTAPRVYVMFQIYRDGRVVNPQLTASSGLPSLDRSALRAVYDSSPMPPLPPDYPGSSVAVQFWFDFNR